MLYVTTRNDAITYTAHLAINQNISTDGGKYIPFRLPAYENYEICALKQKSFNQIVAEILNMFFSARLTALDLDLCIGRNAPNLCAMNHRLIVAELWHNPKACFDHLVESLYNKLRDRESVDSIPTDWLKIAVYISAIFGIYGDLLRQELVDEGQLFDISVLADDFTVPMAAWYARKMGLPIGTIISTCDESENTWDFIHRGILNCAAASKSLLSGLEKLIQVTLGHEEVGRFVAACEAKRIYSLDEEQLSALNAGLFCAVAGGNRASSTINSVFRTNGYILDPLTALCCGGLQDYRAKVGTSRITLLMAQRTPLDFTDMISGATGIDANNLIEYVKL